MTANPPITIRQLDESEVAVVSAVLGLARLFQGDGQYFVAWDGAEPVGHAYLAITDPPELQDVEVRPGYRRRGVASGLTGAIEAMALSRGCHELTLSVSATNTAAQELYRALGFSDTGLPPRVVRATVLIRTGPLEVDDVLLTWTKSLERTP